MMMDVLELAQEQMAEMFFLVRWTLIFSSLATFSSRSAMIVGCDSHH